MVHIKVLVNLFSRDTCHMKNYIGMKNVRYIWQNNNDKLCVKC